MTRKITLGVAAIKQGRAKELRLGNLDAKRDWGFARDYVEAMWRMLQQDAARRLRDRHRRDPLGARVLRGGVRLRRASTGSEFVKVDPKYFRPAEVDLLLGDAAQGPQGAGLEPRVTFKELARLMVEADLEMAGKHLERPR